MNCYSISAQFFSFIPPNPVLLYTVLYFAIILVNQRVLKTKTKPIKNDENTPFFNKRRVYEV